MTTPRRAPSLASALAALVAMLACGCGCARAPAAPPAIVSMRVPAVATTPPRNADGTLNALVEIPAGTNEKWEASESDPTLLEWERLDGGARRVVRYLAYPANYGIMPDTLQRAGLHKNPVVRHDIRILQRKGDGFTGFDCELPDGISQVLAGFNFDGACSFDRIPPRVGNLYGA